MKRFILIALLALPFVAFSQGYDYVSTLDTITNTEKDTVTTFSKKIYPAHTVGLQCQLTELSGTSDITVYLEGSLSPAGNVWTVAASDTIVNGIAAESVYMVLPSSSQNFVRYRYRVSGDAGTQSTQYRCVLATKPD
jgi:hypothetical protein